MSSWANLSFRLPGGPAGSYAASVLAREGISVTVLEASKFPRYHVGESLIPSVRHYMRFIGADQKLASYGFVHKVKVAVCSRFASADAAVNKPGSAIKFNQYKREGYTDFMALGADNAAFNVTLNAPSPCPGPTSRLRLLSLLRPLRPHLRPPTLPDKPTDSHVVTGTTTFTHLIDASGRAGLMSTTYLKNRHFNSSLKNIAVWGYWKGAGSYGVGTSREGAPWFEALTDESGWAWFIPLHNGFTSVGVVMNQKIYNEKMKDRPEPTHFLPSSIPNPTRSNMVNHYISNILLAPGVFKLMGNAVMEAGSVKSATDFSYSAPSYGDCGYRIIGDAGGKLGVHSGNNPTNMLLTSIDPFFFVGSSSGAHFGSVGGIHDLCIDTWGLYGSCCGRLAYEACFNQLHEVVVLSAYKQIRSSQSADILSDIDEDNFDRAFSFLRPVIQGASDMGKLLSETELQKSLDFCVNLFNPTTPEQHNRVANKAEISQALLDVAAPLVDPAVLEKALHVEHKPASQASPPPSRTIRISPRDRSASEVAETRMVLNKINARRVVHAEYAINNLESEPIAGYVVRLEKGRLGLTRSNVSATLELMD
ncbi:hypothetical protein MVEN_00562700 [Mycena venus]|uniref:FAD/NAD(P)-binding domain-containing protein n=1 Tax=Mycena venus TaxID=2733690 RepID=A0A8H6YPV1_9AGAR|nr:hypothetical protein MVEN_00562700 [Mycena venus]